MPRKSKKLNRPLQVGDDVTAAPNGQPMTIRELRADGSALCVWKEGNEPKQHTFVLSSLSRYVPTGVLGLAIWKGP
ncbi:uncharacterized protein YodC (DUF2158 family) [Beijerinckia sp. GAS462]|nr:uncharacterized protein YodC (DUF2158 family) [Beijerinckia sp. GAS462]SEB83270.1 Uncharacterized conserved protein YodC, DUF2158 family [Beijerinckia sp. 28-YEA-48]